MLGSVAIQQMILLFAQRQPDREGATKAQPSRVHTHRTAMGFHQLAYQRQANAQAFTLVGLVLVFRLPEQVEDFFQAVCRPALRRCR